MSEQDQVKAAELETLLKGIQASGSFESATLTERIATLAKDVFRPEREAETAATARTEPAGS